MESCDIFRCKEFHSSSRAKQIRIVRSLFSFTLALTNDSLVCVTVCSPFIGIPAETIFHGGQKKKCFLVSLFNSNQQMRCVLSIFYLEILLQSERKMFKCSEASLPSPPLSRGYLWRRQRRSGFNAQLDSVYNGARRSGEDSPASIKWSPSSAPLLFSQLLHDWLNSR